MIKYFHKDFKVTKIADLKLAIIDPDNLTAIENIESYKQIVVANANLFSANVPVSRKIK